MKVAFYAAMGGLYDCELAGFFGRGVQACGDEYELVDIADHSQHVRDDVDAVVVVGVKDQSKPVFEANRRAGKHAMLIDKGYARLEGTTMRLRYWRVTLNEFQPTGRLCTMPQQSFDRWAKTGLNPKPWRRANGNTIIFCSSSQKYNNWHNLGESTEYARSILERIKEVVGSQFRIVYRPKPSSKEGKEGKEITGFGFSPPKDRLIYYLNRDAHCVVTFGSNSAVEAVINGVPAIVVGDCVARPISSAIIEACIEPHRADFDAVRNWLANLAYWQWEPEEMADGSCWRFLRSEMERDG